MAPPNSDSSGQPLFIVDRDWLRQGSKTRKSWTGNVRNRSLYGLAIQVTQYDVPGAAARRKSQTRNKRRRRDKQGEATDSESQGESESSFPHEQPLTQVLPPNAPLTVSNRQPADTNESQLQLPASIYGSWPQNPALHPPVSSGMPGFECIKGLECYLDYCENLSCVCFSSTDHLQISM